MNKNDKILKVETNSKSYDILIGDKIFKENFRNTLINLKCLKDIQEKKMVFITDENLYMHYKSLFEGDMVIVVDAGEKSKSVATYENVSGQLIDLGITRSDVIVAVGGGVVGDLAGFIAATYLRGVDFIQVPTSLLAMVDSSVGGKVAINHSKGKNMLGNFYQPAYVVVDINLLNTLPYENYVEGIAEIIKYALIREKDMFEKLYKLSKEEVREQISDIIETCLKIKSQIVKNDELDFGERMLLNYGHTYGHAVEGYYNYKKYSHGQGVAIGMAKNALASHSLGMIEEDAKNRIIELIEKYDLPIKCEDNVLDEMKHDKKTTGAVYRDVCIETIGKSYIKEFTFDELVEFYEERG